MDRKDGYYWVKDASIWIVAKYDSQFQNWSVTSNENEFVDADFEEINEDLIVEPKFNLSFKGRGNWIAERCSGYEGYRCQNCFTWVYDNSEKKCNCDKNGK